MSAMPQSMELNPSGSHGEPFSFPNANESVSTSSAAITTASGSWSAIQQYPTSTEPAQDPIAVRNSDRKEAGKQRPKQYMCLSPGCSQRAFARSADLDRHYKQLHTQMTEKEQYSCDYSKCPRSDGGMAPFFRKDHFRDHLRDFHREDLPKRGSGSASFGSSTTYDDLGRRNINARWWRCIKCLQRVYVDPQGWECPDCKTTCERERRLARIQASTRY